MGKLRATEVHSKKQLSLDITEMVKEETHTCAEIVEVSFLATKVHHPIRFSLVS